MNLLQETTQCDQMISKCRNKEELCRYAGRISPFDDQENVLCMKQVVKVL